MTRKNSTVNPKAGTLKQTNRALQTNRQSGFVKSIAFALLLSMTVPAMSHEQGDAVDTGVGIIERIDRQNPENCCLASEPTVKQVKLSMPSREMIRKSDSEAIKNLMQSLTENKLHALRFWLARADREMSWNFEGEYAVKGNMSPSAGDTEIMVQFNAENLAPIHSMQFVKADVDMVDFFQLDNEGLRFSEVSLARADEEINSVFSIDETQISVPCAADYANADRSMAIPGEKSVQRSIAFVGKSYERF
jgi:hypothetical protein